MSRWLSEAGLNANAKEVKRALEICVENANHSIFNAASSNPQRTRGSAGTAGSRGGARRDRPRRYVSPSPAAWQQTAADFG